jgi:hypothetical protein
MGFLNQERDTINFRIGSFLYFGEKLSEALYDWF